jgi:hypothetical protein
MSLNEELFLKELKYDDTILDIEETIKPPVMRKIKIVNNDMCKRWLKNKKKYKHLKKRCEKSE